MRALTAARLEMIVLAVLVVNTLHGARLAWAGDAPVSCSVGFPYRACTATCAAGSTPCCAAGGISSQCICCKPATPNCNTLNILGVATAKCS